MAEACDKCGCLWGAWEQADGVPYDVGLEQPVLLAGAQIRKCTSCGNVAVRIPGVAGLFRVIAHHIAASPGRLTGAEIRFLRKTLGWSGRDLARRMRVAPETVSRWETGAAQMGEMAEQLLRVYLLAQEKPIADYAEWDANQAVGRTRQLRLRRDQGHWELAA